MCRMMRWRFSLFGHTARLPDETDTKNLVESGENNRVELGDLIGKRLRGLRDCSEHDVEIT